MTGIDIFNIKPSKISRDLRGKYILIYGSPKTGKSSFAARLPKALFLQFEQGTNALDNIIGQPIFTWKDMRDVLKQLRDPRGREHFDTVIVDTATIAYNLCTKWICAQNGVKNISEVSFGDGFNQVAQEFQETWREISLLGYGIIFIAHSKDKLTDMRNENGEQITTTAPDLPSRAYTVINGLVDIIGYLSTQMNKDGTTERYLYTRATPTIFAGSRYKYIAPRINFSDDGYTALVNAIGEAIDMQVEKDGAQVTDRTELPMYIKTDYAATMEKAKNIWTALRDKAKAMNEIDSNNLLVEMNTIIKENFGKEIKLSQVGEEQVELLEATVNNLEKLL